ncbi:MAG: hypothetical protein MUD01_18625 [Chloroflexaceae bacterium]|jgi:hypothetical protein|nr:hypothetical protein [Chloroflexaceae bacterium]
MEFQTAIAILLYPGLLLALGLGVAYGLFVEGRLRQPFSALASLFRRADGVLALCSMLLAGLALSLLPWPMHPVPPGPTSWVWAWAALEGAFLLPLLPALFSGHAALGRAAMREAQLGGLSRALLWLALATSLLVHADWQPMMLPTHVLAMLAALVGLPIALGWGPFGPERGLTPGGVLLGLDHGLQPLVQFGRLVSRGALLATALVALLPVAVVQPTVALLLLAAVFAVAGALLRLLQHTWPRLPLPAALQVCWTRALPLGLAALVAMLLVGAV